MSVRVDETTGVDMYSGGFILLKSKAKIIYTKLGFQVKNSYFVAVRIKHNKSCDKFPISSVNTILQH